LLQKIDTTSQLKTTIYSLLILLVCCVLGYWPVSFSVFSLKNDALNYFLPVRYQISEAISRGFWPLWSPYFNLGYPLHGDMQSGVWNPFVQLISLFGPYTLKTLQYETLLYVYLSGVSMYFLTNQFYKNWTVCLLVSVGYMLCGFNSDSAQFLNWISATSFLPFVFLFYYRTLIEKDWKSALLAGLFLYLLFTTAYPADFILSVYLIGSLLIWHLYNKRNRTKSNLVTQFKLHTYIFISFCLLSLPAILSYIEFLPLTERGSGASYQDVMSNSLHPSLLFSYLTPLPVWKASFANITDPLERNSYFGIITFFLATLSFFIKSDTGLTKFVKLGFVLSTVFSFGSFGGIRAIAYNLLPLMNTFRHPANAKLFTIFFGCLLAAIALNKIQKNEISENLQKKVWIAISIVFVWLLIWGINGHHSLLSFRINNLKYFIDTLSFSDLLLINICIQLPFIYIIYLSISKKINYKTLLFASILNCTLHSALFQPFTVVKKDSTQAIQNILNSVQVKGYPFPDLNSSIKNNSKNGDSLFNGIGTLNMYNKKIGRIPYRITPSNLLSQNSFWNKEDLKSIILKYPFFYRADTAIKDFESKLTIQNHYIVAIDQDSIRNKVNHFQKTLFECSIIKFSPDEWVMNIKNPQNGFYTMFQN
jgi:hypothetical protein